MYDSFRVLDVAGAERFLTPQVLANDLLLQPSLYYTLEIEHEFDYVIINNLILVKDMKAEEFL